MQAGVSDVASSHSSALWEKRDLPSVVDIKQEHMHVTPILIVILELDGPTQCK